jgi:hypothetical protein
MSVRWTNRFWSVSLELILFLDFLNIFVKMHLAVCFAGKKFIFFGPTDQKLWTFEVLKRSMGMAGMCWRPTNKNWLHQPKKVGSRNKESWKKPFESFLSNLFFFFYSKESTHVLIQCEEQQPGDQETLTKNPEQSTTNKKEQARGNQQEHRRTQEKRPILGLEWCQATESLLRVYTRLLEVQVSSNLMRNLPVEAG